MRATEYITIAARLIAPVLEKDSWIEGYEWVVKTLEKSQHTKIASELTIAKSLQYVMLFHTSSTTDMIYSLQYHTNAGT